MPLENFYTMSSYYDDFHNTMVVYGTSRQIEANHTLALRFSKLLGDRVSERMPLVKKESEITKEELASSDLIILGGIEDNGLMKTVANKLDLILGKNLFKWQGKTYGDASDGLFAAFPNPFNPEKFALLFIANSALQLHQMTKEYNRMPAWALFKEDKIEEKGFYKVVIQL